MASRRPGSAGSKTAWNDAEFDGGRHRDGEPSGMESEMYVDGEVRVVGEAIPERKRAQQIIEVEEEPDGCWYAFKSSIRGMWATRETEDTTKDKDLHVKTTLRELVVYILFLVVIGIISHGMTSTTFFNYTKVMKTLFVDQPLNSKTTSTYRDISSMNDLWDYLGTSGTEQGAFQNALFAWNKWYNNDDADQDGYLYHVNKLLGVPRIRQLKVRNDSCTVHPDFASEIKVCYDAYSASNSETRPFGDITQLTTLTNETAWTYSTAKETNGSSFTGDMADYDGAGYYIDLTNDPVTTAAIVAELKKNKWIDRGTRAVLIDFTTYNANINLFSVIKLIVEFPPTGGAFASAEFRTVKLLRYVNAFDYFVAACECFFMLFLVYYTIEELIEICRHKCKYFKTLWNWLDIIILTMGYVSAVFSVYRLLKVDSLLDELLSRPNAYANFDFLSYWQVQFNNVMAIMVFFAWIKIFKYISFNKTMTQLSSTLSRCAKDLAGFAVMFFIVFLAFAQLGYLIFGTQVETFSTFSDSLFTLFRIILGDFDFVSLEQAHRVLGPLYFILYVFFVFFVLINMFLAIINDTYAEVKESTANQKSEFEISEFMKKSYNKMLDKLNLRKDRIVDIQQALRSSDVDGDKTVDYEEWRRELKARGYAENEIEALFARFDTDGDRALDRSEQNDMLRELENQKKAIDQEISDKVADDDDDDRRGRHGRGGVGFDEFALLQRRVDRMEHSIGSIVSKIDAVLVKLEGMEKAKLKRREAMSKLLDSIRESDATEEQKRARMEELVREELDKWDQDGAAGGNGAAGQESLRSAVRRSDANRKF